MKQSEALDILKLGHNAYLTGRAGSGKTYVLNEYINYLKSYGVEVGVTASTGIAATHLEGTTAHSWTGLGIRDKLDENDCKELLKKARLIKRFDNTHVLIIDEVSMLHAHQLDLINQICQMFRRSLQPFGGMQVILCGDFFQLPPVGSSGGLTRFVYTSQAWQQMHLKICYLQEQHRHTDNELTTILNDIRSSNTNSSALQSLRVDPNKTLATEVEPTKLYTHNADVDRINYERLKLLPGKAYRYNMQLIGNKRIAAALQKSCLAPEELLLKKDAVVMFVKNDPEQRYVNGTLGKVVDFDHEKYPIIKTVKGHRITARPTEWSIEEGGKLRAQIVQLPLRLAWAITIHKSQGMSLDAAEVNLGKTFEKGMGYVALSRVRALSGLRLLGLNKLALEVNEEVAGFDQTLLQRSQEVVDYITKFNEKEKQYDQESFLRTVAPAGPLKKREFLSAEEKIQQAQEPKISTFEQTKLLMLEQKSIEEIAKVRDLKIKTIISHIEKLAMRDPDLDINYLKPSPDRLDMIKDAFEQSGDDKLTPVKELLGDNFSFEEIQIARVFILHR